MRIGITTHAADRLRSRLGIQTQTGLIMDIQGTFEHSSTYWDHRLKQIVQSWYCTTSRVVFIVADEPGPNGVRALITVINDGDVVDAVYHAVDQQRH
jgi:hypothetical protein